MSKQESQVSYFIKTAKTKKSKDGRVLELIYDRITERNGKISKTQIKEEGSNDLVHPDLLKSLKAFLPHFLLLSERANVNDFQPSYFKKKEYLKKEYPYEVTGIHIKEKDDQMHVILLGRQNLKSGRGINIVLPMVCYTPDEDNEDKYPFHEELNAAVDGYLTEVENYMDGKIGTSDQTEIEFDNVKNIAS